MLSKNDREELLKILLKKYKTLQDLESELTGRYGDLLKTQYDSVLVDFSKKIGLKFAEKFEDVKLETKVEKNSFKKTSKKITLARILSLVIMFIVLALLLKPWYVEVRYGLPEERILSEIPEEYRDEAREILEELPKGLLNDFTGKDLLKFLDGTTPYKPEKGYWKYVLSNKTPMTNRGNAPSYGWDYPPLFELSKSIVEGKGEREGAEALMYWVMNNIKYDYGSVNIAYSPKYMLSSKKGVCEQKATLYIAMARSVGIPARKVHAGFVSGQPGHAWIEVYVDSEWIMVDPTNGWFDMPYIFRNLGWNFDYVTAAEPNIGEEFTIDRKSYYFP